MNLRMLNTANWREYVIVACYCGKKVIKAYVLSIFPVDYRMNYSIIKSHNLNKFRQQCLHKMWHFVSKNIALARHR